MNAEKHKLAPSVAMALSSKNNNSSIAMALAGMTASVDIPKPVGNTFWDGKDSFAAVAARSLPNHPQPAALPTPPNSISPSLPPQGFKNNTLEVPATPPAHATVDSDFDLQDAVDHAKAQDQTQRGLALVSENLAGLDTTGAITPGLLAKHHLPDILLNYGPLAIRHVMGYLTTSVPGFSGIPPAKARRLVVGALEGRGSGGEGGGIHGDVEFEKVGWGKWDAKRRGQSTKDARGLRRLSPLAVRYPSSSRRGTSPYAHAGVRIPRGSSRQELRRSNHFRAIKVTAKDLSKSHDTDMDSDDHLGDMSMLEDEADKMSLDGDEFCTSSEAPDEPAVPYDDLDEMTDEEDWASIGAAALRQGSFPLKSGGGRIYPQYFPSTTREHSTNRGGGLAASSKMAKSVPMPRVHRGSVPPPPTPQQQRQHLNDLGGFVGLNGIGGDSQEREAIAALVRLSSV